ncbi:Cytochrome b5 heme-binding domain-containing protein [Plasmodiophora brassicae]
MAADGRVITKTELAAHSSVNDAWVAIHGNVYDVTKFLDDHPGGADIILNDAGQDVTQDFEDMNHSINARDMLKPLRIGELEGATVKDPIDVLNSTVDKAAVNAGAAASKTSDTIKSGSWIYMGIVIVIPIAVGLLWKAAF